MVAGEVAHVWKNASGKVDVAAPSVGLVIPLVEHQPATLDYFPVQAKNVQRCVVTAASQLRLVQSYCVKHIAA